MIWLGATQALASLRTQNDTLLYCRDRISSRGRLKVSKELIKGASEAGADAVKFQLFSTSILYHRT